MKLSSSYVGSQLFLYMAHGRVKQCYKRKACCSEGRKLLGVLLLRQLIGVTVI